LFEVGREVASLPTTELVWPIARTLFPGYALAAGDRAMMRKLFLDSSAIMLCLGVPLALGIAATSELVVRIALGTNWLGAIPVIEIMAVCGVVRLSYSGCQSIIMALGKPNLYAQLAFWSFVVTLPPMVYGAVKYGLTGAAIGYLAGIVLSAAMSQLSALRLLELRLRDFARASKRSIAAGLLMYAAIAATLHWLPPSTASPLELGVLALMCVVAGAAVYIAGLLGLWRLEGKPAGGEQILYDEFRRRIGRA
jgi:O-antigen/teichoic acid export membrane protein